MVILLVRLATHWHQHRRLNATTWIVISSILVLLARTICNALILRWATAFSPTSGTTPSMARVGSILTLISRVLVTTYYWLQSIELLLFYRDMMAHIPWICRVIKMTWLVLAGTYTAVVLATFLECRPITLYWSLTPGSTHPCRRAYTQLLLQCLSNALIDILLLTISAPILQAQARAFPRNLQLGLLYILGFFCIIVIGVKIHYIYRDGSVQHARSFWASIQVVVATFVANAPSIYGGVRKERRRRSSVADPLGLGRVRTAESGGEMGVGLALGLGREVSPVLVLGGGKG
ncbi:hypothetical protein CLAFUW4_02259 [Fulvia fulva]|uniref:Rhodopsin domain-containing protein n=1 Tax=Passalora fulva TaxID=5499 RepID=A0A9Q8L561_PASFU|nr:uncharacterized protein CLAFUR5_02250 [Fulvia fulva]KAK4635448.1 hypothetical protein CLAFUR4_02254 [Fulvia fulva]KAK4637866.1 hypothetical protein CLAFUR0_02258 [Fulvia fulva]UJO10929.1 hypothetical protein CLAFUR5_02250 [Fulvia fulva]WPV09365.1 hypothetical protein CLAFUW4_02259 [Fulvia fulva]WPV23190.1 hypothetical protein CLAFUW7_02259 [Fulvia fulva]